MTKDHRHSDDLRKVTRRDFLKLAAAAGLLAGCSPRQQPAPEVTPTGTLAFKCFVR